MIESIVARPLEIPFKAAFSHASASRDITHGLWVEVRMGDGAIGYGEGCPRVYVTGETLSGALAFVSGFTQGWLKDIRDVVSLVDWIQAHRTEIDTNPAAWCAVELALLDAFSKQAGQTTEEFLGLPGVGGEFRYTAVLGDSDAACFACELTRYRQAGLRTFKIKLSGDVRRDLDKTAVLKAAGIAPDVVRADANNLWTNPVDVIQSLARLDYEFWAIEEPVRVGDRLGMNKIATEMGCAIILDESLVRVDQLSVYSDLPAPWIVNLRISKMGGLLRSLEVLHRARRSGLRLIIGSHVGETSLLARAALTIANTARDILVAQEEGAGSGLNS